MKKKKMLLLITTLLFLPIFVLGKEELIITYDSNDGTNRTEVQTLEKGDSYKMAGENIFGLSKGKNSLGDTVIGSWNTAPDGTGKGLPLDRAVDSTYANYSYLNDVDNIRLYAIWENRKDVARGLSDISLTGDGASTDGDGNYRIDTNKSYNLKFTFQETSSFQFGQLSYYKLPDYFLEVLKDEDARAAFGKERTITLNISYRGQLYPAKGSYYIEGDYLCLNLLKDGTYENQLMASSTNLTIRIWYYCTVSEERYNNRLLRVKQYEFNTSDSTSNNIKIYPKGKIVAKFINEDGSKQLAEDITTREILGTKYAKLNFKIKGYELTKISNNGDYLYEEGIQTVYYRYKKIPVTNIITNPKTETGILVIIVLIIVASIALLLKQKNISIVKGEQ